MSVRSAALPLLLAALLLGGCRSRQAAPVPPTQQPEATAPREVRVGVVDLEAVAKAHPRWKELDTLARREATVEADLALVPPPPPVPQTDVRQSLTDEAAKIRASFEAELSTLREQRRRDLEAYVEDVKKQQQAKLEETRARLETEAQAAITAKRDELKAQLHTAEQQIMDEYRYPLLNLRLRAEVAGLRSEEEGRQVLRQLQALQQEREERIRAKGEETERQFLEFQKAKEAEINERLKAEQEALNAESQRLLDAKEKEIQSELSREAAARERTFQQRLEERRKTLLLAAEQQLRGQQSTFLRDLDERARRLRAELAALREQRARLEDSILAEVKIEVATIAQAQSLDVVLTRAVLNRTAVDITKDVIRKLKR